MIPFNLLINLLMLFVLVLLLVIVLALVVGRIAARREPAPAEAAYDDDPKAAVARIRGRFNRRARFASHAALFGGYALAVLIFLQNPAFWRGQFGNLPNPGDLSLVLVLWAFAFAAHAASFLVQEAGDRALQRELDIIRRQGKPKRDRDRLLLSDDGEVLALDDSEMAAGSRRSLEEKT